MTVTDMDTWRSIDYEGRLKREISILGRASIPEKSKEGVLRYKNHRLIRGISVARFLCKAYFF